ncbi:DUF2790 domain-containing protein [Pseudomonas typographi]|uniref:DUF2790 domain-containing protein n=1 Tax=Pseudomonas typographi TaxID=2715964 RepID=A0ABR7Z1A1_9PSED|nr:DUF2790 domain-containing protein [Pseudomonas typographi]MBD1554623.1 DUF2790 domain-containing protein [Pseudomonas typographi]MBD1589740.1 DUF2790 domain-containing protein [Pseudomonas typographi]MBD1599217.1 DUF2790 domain-containing protein [Pseudomonas typographi]
MKAALWAIAFCGACATAMADQAPQPTAPAAVEHYHYGMALDIAQVLKQPRVPQVCGVVPVQMTYLDSQHQQHILEYLVVGDGCNNG